MLITYEDLYDYHNKVYNVIAVDKLIKNKRYKEEL